MIKKTLSVFLLVLMILPQTACTKANQNDNKLDERVEQYYQNDEFYYDYKTNHYKFRLPKYWKGKYIVSVTERREDFYESNSYDKDETGLLFSILEYEDKSYKKDLKGRDYIYLGYDKRFELHYIFLMPEEEKYPEEFKEQYEALKEGIHIAKRTFKAEL